VAVNTKITGVWDVVQCGLVDCSHGVRGTSNFRCFAEQSVVLDAKALCKIVTYVCTDAIYASKYVRIIVIHTHIYHFMARKSEGIVGVCNQGCQN
jgi:hypothetical protein